MRRQCVVFEAPCQVAVRDEAMPAMAPDQMRVQTIASAISSGTELLFYRGQAPADLPADATIETLAGATAYPMKYGYAAVGQVTTVGANVAPDWIGRLVFAFNPHESAFLARPDQVIPLPEGMTPDQAVFLPNMETAVNFLMDGGPLIGESAVVLGQGVVGLLTAGLLARMPLARLITLDRYALRREMSRSLGATVSFDPSEPGALNQALDLLAGQGGADLTYELSGNPSALNDAVSLTGHAGRIVIGSWYGQKRAEIDLGGRFHRSRIRLLSSQVSTIDPAWTGRWTKARRIGTAWEMIRRAQPERLITHRFAARDAAQAYAMLDQNPEQTLQVVLTY
jgi:2-desacetyl-2-hydroxyethyl bacteriochlorophyllide A dehydrogenase